VVLRVMRWKRSSGEGSEGYQQHDLWIQVWHRRQYPPLQNQNSRLQLPVKKVQEVNRVRSNMLSLVAVALCGGALRKSSTESKPHKAGNDLLNVLMIGVDDLR
jgi:hypothetical protein